MIPPDFTHGDVGSRRTWLHRRLPSDRPSAGDSDVGLVAAVGVVVVFEHEVPTVEAVLASVGDHVAVEPDVVLSWWREEEAAAAAVDARDLSGRFQHGSSMPLTRPPVACGHASRCW